MGTKSILFKAKIIFLSGIPNIFRSIFLHRQASGSLTSSTSTIISQASISFFISLWYLLESWWACTNSFSCSSSYTGISNYFYCSSKKWCKCSLLYVDRLLIVWVRSVYLFFRVWITFFLKWSNLGGCKLLSTELQLNYVFWTSHVISVFFAIFDVRYYLCWNYG